MNMGKCNAPCCLCTGFAPKCTCGRELYKRSIDSWYCPSSTCMKTYTSANFSAQDLCLKCHHPKSQHS